MNLNFILVWIYLYDNISWDRLSDNSTVSVKEAGYDSPDSCRFEDLYTYKDGLFKTSVEITPLGKKVYDDLKKLAKDDYVSLSEPFPDIHQLEYGNKSISMHVKFEYNYR